MSKILKPYKKELLQLFYMSVEKDIDNWERVKEKENDKFKVIYCGPYYNGNIRFILLKNKLYVDGNRYSEKTELYRFKFWFIPLRFKIYWYKNKIKKNIIRIKLEKKYSQEARKLDGYIKNIEINFPQEIRREKLKKIKKA